MRVINTASDLSMISTQDAEWVYNGIDAAITKEIDEATEQFMVPDIRRVYNFSLRQLRPALVMMLRGIKIDQVKRANLLYSKIQRKTFVEKWLNEMARAVWDRDLNPRSPQQLKTFFYDTLQIPEVLISFKGERKVSTNREALEKIYNNHEISRPIINAIFSARDLSKLISVLQGGMSDGRFRTTFNPVGTNTGRWSSSASAFGTGSNIQNITYELREIFIPDEGYYLGYTDLEQAEARSVAYYSGDLNYIEACESGDLHTYTARRIWPDLPWTGDLSKDRAIAERPFYRHFSYRDMSKRGGHATNYYATPWTVSRHLKIELSVAEQFQELYFNTFPGIRAMHHKIARLLMSTRCITTPMGRVRHFFGRPDDDATLRKAIAYVHQSTIVDSLNQGLCSLVENSDPNPIEVLAQMHDGIVWQSKHNDPEFAISVVEKHLKVPIPYEHREATIPAETKLGYNWKDMKKVGAFLEEAR